MSGEGGAVPGLGLRAPTAHWHRGAPAKLLEDRAWYGRVPTNF